MATKKKAKRPVAHRDPVDEHAATELVIFIENTSDLSPDGPQGQGHSVFLNALRKWKKGTYNPELAVRLFQYLADAGAKRYEKEFGSDSPIFNPATRHEAARQLEASFRSYAENGEYDHVDTRIGMHEQMRAGMTDQNLVPFHSWPELMTYARAGGPLFYKAPMDHRATRLTKGHGTPNSYEVHARTLRMWPPGSVGRGRSRTADPFTADAGHLPRFFMPTDEVGGRVYEPRQAAPDKRAVDFFYKHAGYGYGPGETPEQGKKRGAVKLANAEQEATARGWTVDWEQDPDGWDSLGDIDPDTVKEILTAVLHDEDGKVLASLGGIVDPDRAYGRVVEAELALEALSETEPRTPTGTAQSSRTHEGYITRDTLRGTRRR